MMKQHLCKIFLLLAMAAESPHVADAQVTKVCESLLPYDYDSGDSQTVSTQISIKDAPWIQLDLTETQLAAGATLTIASDKESQDINSDGLLLNPFTGVFDGNTVNVTLTTTGGIRGVTSRVVISQVNVGLCEEDDDIIAESICGDKDDRIASTDVRVGRIGGCTGWLISEDVFVQAGHCGTPTSSTRIHFTYGRFSASLSDQYAVDLASYAKEDGGIGKDWGVGRLLPNAVTGKLPGVAQSEKCGLPNCGWFEIGTVPSSTNGNNIRITGYGTASVASRSQKTHVGPLAKIWSTYLRYRPDTTGGNSGSPVIHEETGKAIGVHTHAGCSSSGGSNQGTRIDRPSFAAKIAELLRTPSPTSSPTTLTSHPTSSPKPSYSPTGTPSVPPGKSPTKNFSNSNSRNANQKAKGIMFQIKAKDESDVIIEKMSFKTKDNKQTEVQIYFQPGSYSTFTAGGLNEAAWGDAVFDGTPSPISGGLMEVVFDNVLTIPAGTMGSFYLAGKKEFMYEQGSSEFVMADDTGDFITHTGSSQKKPFEQIMKKANFVGGVTYHTYTEPPKLSDTPSLSPSKITDTPSISPTKITDTPSTSPSLSKSPSLPPNDDTASPSVSSSMAPSTSPSNHPSMSPTETDNNDTPKEYTTPNVNNAGDNAKGIMFSLTTKSNEVTITSLGIFGKDSKESDVKIYYRDAQYDQFDALNKNGWDEVVYNNKVMLDPDDITILELNQEVTISAGGSTASFYVVSKKGVLYTKASDDEFEVYTESDDFELKVGVTTKKDFEQRQKLAEFAGTFVYQV